MRPLTKRYAGPFLLILAATLFFLPLIWGDRLFLYRDLFFFHYPLKRYWVKLLSSGTAPFLNTALNGGQPLLANPNYAILYPGNLLFAILPFDLAWNLSLAGHVFWAGLGLYWLCRKMRCEVSASLAGACTFAFSGPLLSSMTYHNLLFAAAWIPWILGLCSNAFRKRGRWLALAGLAWTAQLLAGEPTVQLLTAGLLFALYTYGLVQTDNRVRFTGRAIVVLVLSFLTASIQLIPTFLWLQHSSRGAGLDFRLSAAYWSLHPGRLIEFLVPHFYGDVMSDYLQDFWGAAYSDSGYPYILKIYVGWFPFLLAPLAWKRFWGRGGLIIAATGMLLSLGHWLPGYYTLFEFFPPLHIVRYPEKFLLLSSFGWAISTAVGITELVEHREKGRAQKIMLLIAFLLLSILAVVFFRPWPSSITLAQRISQNHAVMQSAISGILTLALILLAQWKSRGYLIAAVPVLLFVDLAVYTWEVPQTLPRSLVKDVPTLLKHAPEILYQPVLHRGEDESNLYFISGADPQQLMKEAFHPLIGLCWGVRYGFTADVDRMGWRLSTARQEWVHQNFPSPAALNEMRESGTGWVISLSPIVHPELAATTFIRLDRKRIHAYRLHPPPLPFVHWKEGTGTLSWQGDDSPHILIQADAAKMQILQIATNALPGWHCKQDQKDISYSSSRDGWIQLPVSAGKHLLELTYRPPGLMAGMLLAAFGTIALLCRLLFA